MIKLMLSMKYGNLLLYDIILHVIYQSESNLCRYSHVVWHLPFCRWRMRFECQKSSNKKKKKLTLLLALFCLWITQHPINVWPWRSCFCRGNWTAAGVYCWYLVCDVFVHWLWHKWGPKNIDRWRYRLQYRLVLTDKSYFQNHCDMSMLKKHIAIGCLKCRLEYSSACEYLMATARLPSTMAEGEES